MHHQHIQLNHYVLLQWYRYSYLQFVNLVTTEISVFYVNQRLPFCSLWDWDHNTTLHQTSHCSLIVNCHSCNMQSAVVRCLRPVSVI